MKIDLQQEEINLIAEMLRTQIDRASQAQMQNPPEPHFAFIALRQIQAMRELLNKLQPTMVPD